MLFIHLCKEASTYDLSRNFVDNSQRVLTDINSRSREYYHFAFSSTEARNEDLQEMASDINALTESIDA
jgi:hypothetical protein